MRCRLSARANDPESLTQFLIAHSPTNHWESHEPGPQDWSRRPRWPLLSPWTPPDILQQNFPKNQIDRIAPKFGVIGHTIMALSLRGILPYITQSQHATHFVHYSCYALPPTPLICEDCPFFVVMLPRSLFPPI